MNENLRQSPVPLKIFGKEMIDQESIYQILTVASLRVAVKVALMPDAHVGYGLPIGGVLATENVVIPYAVGVDIGCRMCMTVYPINPQKLEKRRHKFKTILNESTLFGTGKVFSQNQTHEVLERKIFCELDFLKKLKDKAAKQLGSSGSGNHFVEFGQIDFLEDIQEQGIEAGSYLAVLSHSGSRNLGAEIAKKYTKIAMEKVNLPTQARHLAWLSLKENDGAEYWSAMSLAGDYASACHHVIHNKISERIGEKYIGIFENHHNFAWKENLPDGKKVIVHRKGATPSKKGELGIIPGSMASNTYLVRGKGNEDSLNSSSHGAGRVMSRTQAKRKFKHKDFAYNLKKQGIELIGGSVDESPMVYKDINQVIQQQQELIDVVGRFKPSIVKMD